MDSRKISEKRLRKMRRAARRGRKTIRRRRVIRSAVKLKNKSNARQGKKVERDRHIIDMFRCGLIEFFVEEKFIAPEVYRRQDGPVIILSVFSMQSNYENTMKQLQHIAFQFYKFRRLILDFSNCQECDSLALSFLHVIFSEVIRHGYRLSKMMSVLNGRVALEVKPSTDEKVNHMLFVHQILQSVTVTQGELTNPKFHAIGYQMGTKLRRFGEFANKNQQHYLESKKGKLVTNTRNFVNEQLLRHGFEFNQEGVNKMDNLLGEILGNCEDHSSIDNYYIGANYFNDSTPGSIDSDVGELNITIINLGKSIFQAFEETRIPNAPMYGLVQNQFDKVTNFGRINKFSRESLFTLYALAPGVSRLKFESDSRGSGTMRFINSFFTIGDFEDEFRRYNPRLTVLSGKTMLLCTKKYAPFEKDGESYLTLNAEQSFASLPDPENVRDVKVHFPGTILDIKVYINKEHLNRKMNESTH